MNQGLCLATETHALIGEGSRRICYRHREPTLCVKYYRPDANLCHQARLRVRLHIRMARFNRHANLNYREWRYYEFLRAQLPADLFAVFPERLEPVFSPSEGWGVVESLIANADGTPAERLTAAIRTVSDPAMRLRVYQETERLLSQFARFGVRFFDLGNLLLQWTGPGTFRIRVADIEPCGKELIPCPVFSRFLAGCKVRRRARRFLGALRKHLPAHGLPAGAAAAVTNARAMPDVRSWTLTTRFARLAGLI